MTALKSGKFSTNFGLCNSSSNFESEGPPWPLLTVLSSLSSPAKAFLGHLITRAEALTGESLATVANIWYVCVTCLAKHIRCTLSDPHKTRNGYLMLLQMKTEAHKGYYLSLCSWYSRDLSEPMFVCLESMPSASPLSSGFVRFINTGSCLDAYRKGKGQTEKSL